VPWPITEWSASGRLGGRTSLPLTPAGREQAASWAGDLTGKNIRFVYSSDEECSVETAGILMNRCDARHRLLAQMVEVDVGLWEGLTSEELTRRNSKVFKRWLADPSAICPPEGESAQDATDRLLDGIDWILAKHAGHDLIIILGPIAAALVRRVLDPKSPQHYDPLAQAYPSWYTIGDALERMDDGAAAVAPVASMSNSDTNANVASE